MDQQNRRDKGFFSKFSSGESRTPPGLPKPKENVDGKVERRRDKFLNPLKQILRTTSPAPGTQQGSSASKDKLEVGVKDEESGEDMAKEEPGKARTFSPVAGAESIHGGQGGEIQDGDGEKRREEPGETAMPVAATIAHAAAAESDLDNAIRIAQDAASGLLGLSSLPLSTGNEDPHETRVLNTTFEIVLRKLDTFSVFVESLTEIHPYAKMAHRILFFASDAIIQQMNLDEDVYNLLELLDKTYKFVNDAQQVADMLPQSHILQQLTFKTVQVSYFIVDYSRKKNFWLRTAKNLISSAKDQILVFKVEFDQLLADFRNHSTLHIQIHTFRLLGALEHLSGEFDLNSIDYAKGATGYNSSKQCLPTTRVQILDDISNWVNNQADDVPNVMWLSGSAGTGKSTIAHTIARRFSELGNLGSCFSFDKNAAGDRRHEKIFSTIARDLSDLDSGIKNALSIVLRDASASVKSTSDIIQQWETFILKTVNTISESSATIIGPILIIIDALDESGDDWKSRSTLLSVLSGEKGNIQSLPSNIRILVTSRPLMDIYNSLKDHAHISMKSMDEIPILVAKADIFSYMSTRLLPQFEEFLDSQNLNQLVDQSDGLFQWAYLACEYMLGNSFGGLTVEEKFNDLCSNSSDLTGDVLLQDMYYLILSKLFDIKRLTVQARFQSVMGQILATLDPLPYESLNIMRSKFTEDSKTSGDISPIVNHMGSLLSGITNKVIPIRPVHTSFYDFLKNKEASREFYVDVAQAQEYLAFSSLKIMLDKNDGLHFNIANISSSFLRNIDLESSVISNISPHLVYACKFWANHLKSTTPNNEICLLIHILFFEKFFFWLEVLGLTKNVNKCIETMSILMLWTPVVHEDIKKFADEAQKFIHMFGGLITESIPHMYLSAIPFISKT